MVAVHEPGDRVRDVVEARVLAHLRGRAEDLPSPQEIARLERELAEELVDLRVAGAELDLVPRGLLAFERQIDLALLLVDAEVGLLGDLEVAELLQLLEASLDRLHVHDSSLVEGELARLVEVRLGGQQRRMAHDRGHVR